MGKVMWQKFCSFFGLCFKGERSPSSSSTPHARSEQEDPWVYDASQLPPVFESEDEFLSEAETPPDTRRRLSPNTGRRAWALRMAPSATVVPPPPPLFFTKRVTTFLRANLSDLIRAAVLTTPAGNLLVHASSLPASILRRQCAVAASLWALHHPAPLSFSDANSSNSSSPVPSSSTASLKSSRSTIPAVTVQLDSGIVFVIRQLQCGILFICMGGEEPLLTPTQSVNGTSSVSLASQERYLGEDDSPIASGLGSTASPGTLSSNITPLPSPSVQSLHSTATSSTVMASAPTGLSQANVRALRRQVEELARWLDSRLGALHIPDAGIGFGVKADTHSHRRELNWGSLLQRRTLAFHPSDVNDAHFVMMEKNACCHEPPQGSEQVSAGPTPHEKPEGELCNRVYVPLKLTPSVNTKTVEKEENSTAEREQKPPAKTRRLCGVEQPGGQDGSSPASWQEARREGEVVELGGWEDDSHTQGQ
ncbi:hypothetical protein B0T18DRAFT_490400 [Schizothecium vesticola]|uniref:Uncharacterized protein n=1 Tax=Schizothecium vesticola TaxID=314040 RepID=A0AA40EQS7_9PEZI|nr:hypothetical protein B0T18DRAFT_490400 [Schizothecium vesticola]